MQNQDSLIESQTGQQRKSFEKIAQDYYKQRYAEDLMAQYYIPNQFVKGFFNILLKLSYGLFGIGVALTFESQTMDKQKIILYLQNDRNQTFFAVLIVLGVTILTIIRAIKEDTHIATKTKKNLNFVVDIARTSFYILVLIFIKPFVDENRDGILTTSFWVFLVATVVFVLRKTIKWAYYMFNENGRKVLGPWQSKNPTDKEKLTQFAEFFEFIVNKEYRNIQKKSEDPSK